VSAGRSKVRFLHGAALPRPDQVDLGLGEGDSFSPLFTNAQAPVAVPAGPGIDANGYLETDPMYEQTLVLRKSDDGTELLAAPGFWLVEGAAQSVFTAGHVIRQGSPLSMLMCNDDTALYWNFTDCRVVP
jgi:hypothetical protein